MCLIRHSEALRGPRILRLGIAYLNHRLSFQSSGQGRPIIYFLLFVALLSLCREAAVAAVVGFVAEVAASFAHCDAAGAASSHTRPCSVAPMGTSMDAASAEACHYCTTTANRMGTAATSVGQLPITATIFQLSRRLSVDL